MGALTDNKKRCFVDLCLPGVSSPSPPPKKQKLPSLPTSSPPFSPPPEEPQTTPIVRRLPPAAPLPRPVHAPQRIIRAFGLGSSKSRSKPFDHDMGALLSRLRGFRKRQRSVGWHECLGLAEYKELVSGLQDGRVVARYPETSGKHGYLRSFSSAVSDLTVVTRKEEEEEEASKLRIVNRRLEDARKVTLDVVTPAEAKEERDRSARKGPLYKELLEDSTRKYDSKLSRLDFELRLTESRLSGFRLLRSESEKKLKKEVPEFFAPLTEEEEDEVDHAMHGYSQELLVTHEAANIEITREVLRCLSSGAWLNDEVINIYLELLKDREKRDPKKFLRCHFFNTFFYKKLIGGRSGYDFKAVRRWTTQRKIGYGLIECDKIFVPIHKEIHWCLAVISVKDKKFQYLDSLGGMDSNVLRVLARYLMDEVKDKSDKQVDTMSWKQEMVENLPLQENGWDCGMFMLKYIDFYSRGLDLYFGQEHMGYFRKRTAKEILRLRAE